MRTIWHDIRYGLRQLRRSPGFTAVAVLSLALGIGANTAIFSLINGLLLKSLPVRNPHELRLINWTCDRLGRPFRIEGNLGRINSDKVYCGSFPYPAYRDFVEQARGFSDLFAFSYFEDPKTISAGGIASLANPQTVSGNFFKGYGTQVLIGRPITPDDDRPGAPPVAVLTYPFWRRVYGLDPKVLGQTLMVLDTSFTIVGVLPQRYVGPLAGERRTDFYVPMITQPRLFLEHHDWLNSDDVWWVQIMGRLAPGANEAQVQGSLELLFSNVLSRFEAEVDRPGILLQKGQHGVMTKRRKTAQPLWYLQGVVGLVLLIACTNLAGLLLARGAARQHEMAVRAAMGAGRWRLIRQSLTESVILSLAGVGLGLIFSFWIKAALTGLVIVPSKNQQFNLQIDTNVLVFALTVGVVTALLSGLFPALRAGNTDPSSGLKDSASRGAPRLRMGKVLVTAQVGLSIILVFLGGLLCRTLVNLYRVDPGFDTENLLLLRIRPDESVSRPDYKDFESFYQTIRQKIAGIPGVRSVAFSSLPLLRGVGRTYDISIPGRPEAEQGESLRLTVSDGYFSTMGINLLNGRDFRATDTEDTQHVVIVNEEFGRLFFAHENPVGQFISFGGDGRYQIVGLCSNHKYQDVRERISPIVYIPYTQNRWLSINYMIRSVLPTMSLIPAVRRAVADIDRNLPLEGMTTQKLVLKESIAQERLYASLCGSLALLGLTLSCIGLYGIMAYNIARRTGEIGIRKALGARPSDVARPILREALTLAAIGVTVGLPVALALAKVIQSYIYGIDFYDPITMIGSVVIMVTVAALAAFIPARRAAKIDPMEALRYE
jgi:predicted permease